MSVFRFKQFNVKQELSAMKVGTDAMLLGSLVQGNAPKTILDVGTGTGVISLMLAQRFPEAQMQAVEIDKPSADEAMQNFQNSPWADRMHLIEGDFLTTNFNQSFELIISNPPYYQSRLENDDPRKSQARHESALPMNDMLEKVSESLSEEGSFWIIVPSEIADLWIESASKYNLCCSTIVSITGKEGGEVKRNVLEFRNAQAKIEGRRGSRDAELKTRLSELTIRNSDGTYTDQYIELTKEFHYNSLK